MPRPENPVDPADGPIARFAAELREVRHRAGGLGYRELARRAHYSASTLAQAARGIVLPSLPVTLAYVRACGGNATEWEARWHALSTELDPRPHVTEDGPAPYVGLAAYGPDDAKWFRGRQKLVATLTERVSRQHFVAVVGASGAGKSSVLRAGLVPAHDGPALVLTPGRHPLEECAVQLGALLGLSPGRLTADLTEHARTLGLLLRRLSADFLLVIDQFEEVFTLCQDDAERDRFIDALLTAADGGSRVVVGLRADFYAHCARHPRLVAALQDAQVLVGPMSTDELVQAITQPAARAGLMLEKALITTVVHDAAERPGTLPFVSHALWETWRRRHGTSLLLAGYHAAGGVHGAITQTADRLYHALDDQRQRIAKRILLRLTALGEDTEDTRRRVPRTELDTDPATNEVLDLLAAARLITLGQNTVEIAHEALIRGWPTLREWLAADREKLRAHRRLTAAATDWHRHNRDEGYLYRGSMLATWQDHDPDTLNEMERAFLAAGTARQERDRTARQRRLHISVLGMAVIVVVVSILAVLTVVQTGRTADERDLAFSRQLAANARSQLAVDPELALLLAIEATKVKPTAEADAILRQAIVDSRMVAALPMGGGDAPRSLAVGRDGRWIATDEDDQAVRVWEQRGAQWKVRLELPGHHLAAISRDGRYLATAHNAVVQVLDLDHGGDPVVLPGPGPVSNVEFSPDGRLLAAVTGDGTLVWDHVGRRDPVLLNGHGRDPQGFGGTADIAFSPDGRYLASSGRADQSVWIQDLSGQGQPVVIPNISSWRLTFLPDGRLATGHTDGQVRIWDAGSGREQLVFHPHDGPVRAIEFSPDGRTFASSDDMDGTIQITDLANENEPVTLRGHQGGVGDLAFNRSGDRLAGIGDDGTLRIWSTGARGEPVVLRGHEGRVSNARFAPDGSYIVSGGHDATVRIWNTDGSSRAVLRHPGSVEEVDVSPDGRQIASISTDGVVRLWDPDSDKLIRDFEGLDGGFLAYGPDSRHLASGGNSGGFRIWDVPAGTFTSHGMGDMNGYRQVRFAPDGKKVALAARDGTVQLWSTRGYGQPTVLRGHKGAVTAVAFAPSGRLLASGGTDGTVRLWSTSNGRPIVLHGHQGGVSSVAFHPSGRQFVTTGEDGALRIWNAGGDGEPVVMRGDHKTITSATFSPDGRRLLTAHDDGTIHLQRCEVCGTTEEMLALAQTRTTRRLTADERKTFGL